MHSARPEGLTGGTAIKVVRWIVGKSFIAKNASLACVLGFAQRISHVRGDAACLAGHVVFRRAILVIGHHDLCLAARVALVLIEQIHQLLVLRD